MKVRTISALLGLCLAALACSDAGTMPEIPIQPLETEQSAVTAGNGCANPHYPAKAGATWNYELGGTVTDVFTHTVTSVSRDGFADYDTFGSGATRAGQWRCEGGNLIALTPGAGIALVGAADGSVNVISNSGVTFPANLSAGSAWTQEIAYAGTDPAGGTSQNLLTISCNAAGPESVAVPAGTFDALRVDCSIRLSITVNDSAAPFVVEVPTTAWYAEGIGMVKTVSAGSGFDSAIVLISYQIP